MNKALRLVLAVAATYWLTDSGLAQLPLAQRGYAVVVSDAATKAPEWAQVVRYLEQKHDAIVIMCSRPEVDSQAELRRLRPRYVCFVARPEEIDAGFVRRLHQLARTMDDDPYEDFLWGIVTGRDAEDALRIVQTSEPLVIRAALTTTRVDLDQFKNCLILSDAKPGLWQRKVKGKIEDGQFPLNGPGATGLFAQFYTEHEPDLVLTTGHASEFNLEMPFRKGSLVSWGNRLYTLDREEFESYLQTVGGGMAARKPEHAQALASWAAATKSGTLKPATKPKVVLTSGNCLVGDIMRSTNSMAATWLSSGGAAQFAGYTIASLTGTAGWGTWNLFQNSGGRLTLAEAVYLSNQRVTQRLAEIDPALLKFELDGPTLDRLAGLGPGPATPQYRAVMQAVERYTPHEQQEIVGLLCDRDAWVLYGDPKWEARLDGSLKSGPVSWSWANDGKGTLRLTIAATEDFAEDCFAVLLPVRLAGAKLTQGAELKPMVNDKFLLIPHPKFQKGKRYELELTGKAG